MSAEVYRKYMNIINENSQNDVLTEGVMDALKMAVPKVIKFLGGDTMQAIAQKVKEITGGDFTPSKENAIKVAKALGFEQAIQNKDQMAEGIAGNWQGKLIQLLVSIPMLQTALNFTTSGGFGPFDSSAGNNWLAAVGMLLIIAAPTFFGSDRGQVGVMGRHGNKGSETDKGPTTL
jgi:TRAP-type mannitol/chloroaromatic compound transport system substrate-binding protein